MAGDDSNDAVQELAQLTLEDQPSTTAEPEEASDRNAHSASVAVPAKPVAANNSKGEDDRVDMAIKQALEDSKERATVLSIEEQVEKFILDTKQQLLEFPSTFTNYQRMLAHRIAQHYGLQTSTVDYEDGPGRVIARRTPWCRQPPLKVKLADLKPASLKGAVGVPPKVLVRRPTSEEGNSRTGTPCASTSHTSNSQATAKEREEDFSQARERLIGKTLDAPNMRTMNGNRGRGYMGRGAYNAAPRSPGGRGAKKAVLRDRDKELQDTDYKRGAGRFQGKPEQDARSDGASGYHTNSRNEASRPSTSSSTGPSKSNSPVPTSPARSYTSEYGWNSNKGGYRPPPPPPMSSSSPHHKSYHHPVAQQHSLAMTRPYAPYAMAPYPVPAMGMAYHPGLAPGVAPAAAHAYMPPFGAFPFHQYQMMAPGPDGLHMAAAPYQYYTPYAQPAYPTHMPYAPMPGAMPHPHMNNEKPNLSAKTHGTANNAAKAAPPAQNNSAPAEDREKK